MEVNTESYSIPLLAKKVKFSVINIRNIILKLTLELKVSMLMKIP